MVYREVAHQRVGLVAYREVAHQRVGLVVYQEVVHQRVGLVVYPEVVHQRVHLVAYREVAHQRVGLVVYREVSHQRVGLVVYREVVHQRVGLVVYLEVVHQRVHLVAYREVAHQRVGLVVYREVSHQRVGLVAYREVPGPSASGFSGVSGSVPSASGFSGVSGSGSSASGFSGVSGSVPSASGFSGVSGSGSSASGFSGVSGSGSSASEFSSTSGSGFSGEAGSAVSGSGFSGVGGSESGSGDVCSNLFQAVGPICAAVLQANPCRYEYSSQTCNTCHDLFLSCGQPEEQDIATFCSSEMAQSCSSDFNIVVENLFNYCTFVWSMCYLGTMVENDLCFVEGLLVACTNLQLLSGEYPCECFLPSSQCSLCTSVVSICEPPRPTPVSLVELCIRHIYCMNCLIHPASLPGLPCFPFVLRFALTIRNTWKQETCSFCICQRKPKNRKRGRPGNEAIMDHFQVMSLPVY